MLGFKDYKELIERLLEKILEEFKDNLLSFAVFGSVVRGEAKPLSDIDILIVYKKSGLNPLEKFVSILMKLREDSIYKDLQKKGIFSEPCPIFLSETELKEHPWILLDLIEDSIIIYDKGDILRDTLSQIKERLKGLGAEKRILSDGKWYWDLKPDWKPGETVEL